jgi:predicted DCC family thiol-disulfide oxidoreductase YuxK
VDLHKITPLVIYDNQCYLCTKFAQVVNFLARGKLLLVGHYTELGEKLREDILDSSALEMFWFVDGKTAYGGRAALIPLISAIMQSKGTGNLAFADTNSCSIECKNAKAVFVRSASLITNSRKITIDAI